MVQLRVMREREPSAKALVFSQFATTIDWLKVKLQEQGFGYRTISGSMTLKQRSKVGTFISSLHFTGILSKPLHCLLHLGLISCLTHRRPTPPLLCSAHVGTFCTLCVLGRPGPCIDALCSGLLLP